MLKCKIHEMIHRQAYCLQNSSSFCFVFFSKTQLRSFIFYNKCVCGIYCCIFNIKSLFLYSWWEKISILTNINENLVLHLQFYTSDDGKNFPYVLVSGSFLFEPCVLSLIQYSGVWFCRSCSHWNMVTSFHGMISDLSKQSTDFL